MAKEATQETTVNWERHKAISDEVRRWVHMRIDRILDTAETVDFEDSRSTCRRGDVLHLASSGKFSISYMLAEERGKS